MKFRFIILSLLLLSYYEIARSQQISGTQTRNGFDYSIKVSDEDLQDTPSWNPEKEDSAPVSLRRAIEIARTNLKRFVPESTEKWDVEKVALRQMGKNRWLYEISFYCFLATCGGDDSGGFTIYVKMDGTILEPEKTPNDGNDLSSTRNPTTGMLGISYFPSSVVISGGGGGGVAFPILYFRRGRASDSFTFSA